MGETKPLKEEKVVAAGKDAAIIIMPRSSKAWAGAEALWITAGGWAAAAEKTLGKAWVITSDRISSPREVIDYPLVKRNTHETPQHRAGRFIPQIFKVIVKDILLWLNSLKFRIPSRPPWTGSRVGFVWQQHDLFSGPGRQLADKLGVPLVTYVHAPVVWETSKWGVNRYLWGSFIERVSERRSLRRSDIVLCVSEQVAKKVAEMGVKQERILVSPMAVDRHLFESSDDSCELRESFGLTGKIVIGWVGSFRSFHGLDLLVKAFSLVKDAHVDARLLLVGDGSERVKTERLVHTLGLNDFVIFAGRQAFSKMPGYIGMFDIAIVSASKSEGFHYSPLKLREYLLAGKPTIAPLAGDLMKEFKDEEELLFYKVGDIEAMASKMNRLLRERTLRERLQNAGKQAMESSGTWSHELRRVIDLLPMNHNHGRF